jgi:hypothetical protein
MKPIKRDSGQAYVVDLCDIVLGQKSLREHRFPFLLGDGDTPRRLPVDAYYPDLRLVVEYHERQHSEPVSFFDHPDRTTVSGVPRGAQRAIYDQRRREVLPKHGIHLVEMSYFDFAHRSNKRLKRDEQQDIDVIRSMLRSVLSIVVPTE